MRFTKTRQGEIMKNNSRRDITSARDRQLLIAVTVVGVSSASSFRSCIIVFDKKQLVTRCRDVSRIDGQFVQSVIDSELDEDSALPP